MGFICHWNGEDQFEVDGSSGRFRVHMGEKSCTCRKCDLTGPTPSPLDLFDPDYKQVKINICICASQFHPNLGDFTLPVYSLDNSIPILCEYEFTNSLFSFGMDVTHLLADYEPVDPKAELEDRCKAPCTRPLKEYQACFKRIEGDESGHKHCTGQYFDYWRCVDKCVATKLFSQLK
ncbi:Ubiquinol-cytochrome C reductase hinge protein [Striga hermonthica]|uniref:Complex III subunit VI n=1 Tax=Striga hermonthica TaxID=68872 RepID=A0A9N7RHM9_STRHE|nr:Ubiquinol-cytochrome C reductase hinge protein [Striga hermonthica]